jgi:hypothetical protein
MAPLGDFSLTTNNLSSIAQAMTDVEESHHFYPVLFYFRTAHESESLIRALLVSLDAVSLVRTVLSDREAIRVGQSAPMIQLWRASLMTADMLQSIFLAQPDPPEYHAPEDAKEKWRKRYHAAHSRLARGGLAVQEDVARGAEKYVELRERWQRVIEVLTEHVGFPYERMDPAAARPR